MQRTCTIMAVGCAALLAGCQRPTQPVEPTAQRVSYADQGDADRLWDASLEVLRRHRFPLDRVDRRNGVITTVPVTSQSFFEFWRTDVNTPFDLLEASLRTVRRAAVVEFVPGPDAPDPTVQVTVRRETFATPERQFNNSASTLQIYGSTLPGVQGERRVTSTYDYWIPDGRDAAMEERILTRILARAVVSAEPIEYDSEQPERLPELPK